VEVAARDLCRVWQWLHVFWRSPAPPLVSEDELSELKLRAQQATAVSVLHWLDVESKRRVANCIQRTQQASCNLTLTSSLSNTL
jgi:hypothetical protein